MINGWFIEVGSMITIIMVTIIITIIFLNSQLDPGNSGIIGIHGFMSIYNSCKKESSRSLFDHNNDSIINNHIHGSGSGSRIQSHLTKLKSKGRIVDRLQTLQKRNKASQQVKQLIITL